MSLPSRIASALMSKLPGGINRVAITVTKITVLSSPTRTCSSSRRSTRKWASTSWPASALPATGSPSSIPVAARDASTSPAAIISWKTSAPASATTFGTAYRTSLCAPRLTTITFRTIRDSTPRMSFAWAPRSATPSASNPAEQGWQLENNKKAASADAAFLVSQSSFMNQASMIKPTAPACKYQLRGSPHPGARSLSPGGHGNHGPHRPDGAWRYASLPMPLRFPDEVASPVMPLPAPVPLLLQPVSLPPLDQPPPPAKPGLIEVLL